MTLTILYFAWVRERIGQAEEPVTLPPEVTTVAELVRWLAARGGGYAEAMAEPDRLRAAVDQNFVGPMRPGERIVLVLTAAPHRRDALDACAYLIDRLKTDAPFWKRETRGDDARWVEARESDTTAAERWSTQAP